MKQKDIERLEFIYQRMINIHKENDGYDYMISFKETMETLKNDLKIIKSWKQKTK